MVFFPVRSFPFRSAVRYIPKQSNSGSRPGKPGGLPMIIIALSEKQAGPLVGVFGLENNV